MCCYTRCFNCQQLILLTTSSTTPAHFSQYFQVASQIAKLLFRLSLATRCILQDYCCFNEISTTAAAKPILCQAMKCYYARLLKTFIAQHVSQSNSTCM